MAELPCGFQSEYWEPSAAGDQTISHWVTTCRATCRTSGLT
jgi:hypothetical protein